MLNDTGTQNDLNLLLQSSRGLVFSYGGFISSAFEFDLA